MGKLLPSFQWHSLKTRITLFTLAIFLIGIWSLALYASRSLHGDMRALLAEQQYSTVTYMAQGVNDELTSRMAALQAVASELGVLAPDQPRKAQAVIEVQVILQSLFNGGLFVVRADGDTIASLPVSAARLGVNYMDRDFIAAALKEGKAGIGKPVMGKRLLAPIVVMVTPVRDARQRIVGALAGVIDLSQPNFLDKLIRNPHGAGGGYLIVDARHRLVVNATDKRAIMQTFPPQGASPQIDRFVAGFEGSDVFVDPRGEEVLASVKQVPVAGWYVSARLPTREVDAPITSQQTRILLAALVFTLLAGGLIWWVSHRLLQHQLGPMLAATKTLSSLALGQSRPQALPVHARDEIGELIGGFNRLLDALAQRHSLLQQILDTASVTICLLDTQGRVVRANERMARMFCASVQSLVERDYVSLLHPDEQARGLETLQAVLNGRIEGVNVERLYRRDDGDTFWGHLTSHGLTNAQGEVMGVVVVIADVSDRKHAEELLYKSEIQYRGFLADMPVGILLTQNGIVRYVNHTVQEMIGRSESELLDQPFLPFIAEADRARINDLHQRRMRGELMGASTYELDVIHKNGAIRQWQAYVRTVNWNGQPAGLASFVDVTERRQLEEQIRQLAFYDALTVLPNRRLLHDRLVQAMAASKRGNCHGAVLFLDLDTFKPLNDRHGHDAGDLLLVEAAARLKRCVREIDTVARFGGDEFVVVLTELDADREVAGQLAVAVAEKILAALAAPYRLTVQREGRADLAIEHHCTCSIGIHVFFDHEASADEIITAADAAMYQAKEAGRNAFHLHVTPAHPAG